MFVLHSKRVFNHFIICFLSGIYLWKKKEKIKNNLKYKHSSKITIVYLMEIR